MYDRRNKKCQKNYDGTGTYMTEIEIYCINDIKINLFSKFSFTELVYDENKWFCSVLFVGISRPTIQRTTRMTKQKD
jgi:hypothetical protein